MTSPQGFFSALGHLAGALHRENQLSQTFAACFNRSLHFRQDIVALLMDTCRIPARPSSPREWTCTPQVPTPLPNGGLVDLRVGPPADRSDANPSRPVFYLESKVESPLTSNQLKKYRKHGVSFLIAITKYPPEVSERDLLRLKAFALRWQDVHRVLQKATRPATAVERFILVEFKRYLEELGMAYREDITFGDLRNVQRLLDTISSRRPRDVNPKNSFEVADSCLNILDELRDRFIELHPRFSSYHRWGPGYFVWVDKDDDNSRWHGFGWELFKGKHTQERFGCGLYFFEQDPGEIWWDVSLEGQRVKNRNATVGIKQMLNSNRTLDQNKMLAHLSTAARKWKLI